MKTIQVNTGYGYFKRGAAIVAKAELPSGDHPCDDDSLEYVEVADAAELAAVMLDPPVESTEIKHERLIRQKMRDTAIAALITEGKLPVEYTE